MAEEGGGGGGGRPPRLPRWTRQEILVLIQGKKVAESRGRGRAQQQRHQQGSSSSSTAAALVGAGQPVEPKWATVSAYCRRHGVSRGPVQCRKRWSNLASDYKKIKEWEVRRRSESGGESFWVMRNDLRRERKLPGFFDKEVYDILDGTTEGGEPEEEQEEEEEEEELGDSSRREVPEAAASAPAPSAVAGDAEEPATAAAIFDSGRTAAEDALFSDFEREQEEEGEEDKDDDRPPPAPTSSASPIPGTLKFSSKFSSSNRTIHSIPHDYENANRSVDRSESSPSKTGGRFFTVLSSAGRLFRQGERIRSVSAHTTGTDRSLGLLRRRGGR